MEPTTDLARRLELLTRYLRECNQIVDELFPYIAKEGHSQRPLGTQYFNDRGADTPDERTR